MFEKPGFPGGDEYPLPTVPGGCGEVHEGSSKHLLGEAPVLVSGQPQLGDAEIVQDNLLLVNPVNNADHCIGDLHPQDSA